MNLKDSLIKEYKRVKSRVKSRKIETGSGYGLFVFIHIDEDINQEAMAGHFLYKYGENAVKEFDRIGKSVSGYDGVWSPARKLIIKALAEQILN